MKTCLRLVHMARRLCVFALLCLAGLPLVATGQDADDVARVQRFKDACTAWAAELDRLYETPKESQKETAVAVLAQGAEARPLKEGELGTLTMGFCQAILLVRAERWADARAVLAGLASRRGSAILATSALEDLEWRSRDNGFGSLVPAHELTSLAGELAPISVPGMWRNDFASGKIRPGEGPSMMVDWARPVPRIPRLRDEPLEEVEQALHRLGIWGGDAQVETLYGYLIRHTITQPRRGLATWLSPMASPWWLRAAEYDLAARKEQDAFECIAKAYIFGNAKFRSEAWLLVDRYMETMRVGTVFPAPPVTSNNRDADLRFAVERYQELNMHPRALRLLREHPLQDKQANDDLARRIQEDWDQTLRDYLPDTTTGVVYGKPVETLPDVGRTIPFPESDEALAHVRERFRALGLDTNLK